MNVRSAEGERVVNESRIDHYSTFCPVQQVGEIPKMAVTASNTVAGTIFIQNKDLTRWEPTLFESMNWWIEYFVSIKVTSKGKNDLQVNRKDRSIGNQGLTFAPLWKTENDQIWRDRPKCTLPFRVYGLGRCLYICINRKEQNNCKR